MSKSFIPYFSDSLLEFESRGRSDGAENLAQSKEVKKDAGA
jgi:hypothetical protein